MDRQCECGGFIEKYGNPFNQEKIYEDIFNCNNCYKKYIFKDSEYKLLSDAEFRRIEKSRIKQL